MDQIYRYALYFILGGSTTLAASYMNEMGKGGTAALVASLPIFFIMTSLIAYYTSGPTVAADYARGMVLANVPWLAGVIVFGYGMTQNWNPLAAAGATVAVYLALMGATAGMM